MTGYPIQSRSFVLGLAFVIGLALYAFPSLASPPGRGSLTRDSSASKTQDLPPVPVVSATPARYKWRFTAASATPPADTLWAFNGESIRFDGGSSYDQDEGGSWISSYQWQVNSGATVTTTSSYIHTFTLPSGVTSATHEIKLTISDDEGRAAVKRVMVVVSPDMGRLYYYADLTGSVRTVVNASGVVVETRDYDPWGVELEGRSLLAATQATTQGYAGYTKDPESGLSYAGQRYYLPELGRMLGVDRFASKYPHLTPYQYAANDPVATIDVNGDSVYVEHSRRVGFLGLWGRRVTERFVYSDGKWKSTATGQEESARHAETRRLQRQVSGALEAMKNTPAAEGKYGDEAMVAYRGLTEGDANITVKVHRPGDCRTEGNCVNLIEKGVVDVHLTGGSGISGNESIILSKSDNYGVNGTIAAVHELAHAFDFTTPSGGRTMELFEMRNSSTIQKIGDATIRSSEYYAMYVENLVRKSEGYSARLFYGVVEGQGVIPVIQPKGH